MARLVQKSPCGGWVRKPLWPAPAGAGQWTAQCSAVQSSDQRRPLHAGSEHTGRPRARPPTRAWLAAPSLGVVGAAAHGCTAALALARRAPCTAAAHLVDTPGRPICSMDVPRSGGRAACPSPHRRRARRVPSSPPLAAPPPPGPSSPPLAAPPPPGPTVAAPTLEGPWLAVP